MAHDFEVQNEGSIVLLRPLTQKAEEWLEDNIGEAQYFGKAVAIEPRYADGVITGALGDGLTVR